MTSLQTTSRVGQLARNSANLMCYTQKTYPGTTGENYKGPNVKDFPFRSIRLLGAAQLIIALMIQIVTIVQISLGYADRFVFLAKASVDVWTPLPAIAAGIVGIAITERRYWETQCMKVAYFILSIMSAAVFMMILLFVTGVVEFHFFNITVGPKDKDLKDLETEEKDTTHKALVGTTVALALLELIISFMSVFVICYWSPTSKPKDKSVNKKLLEEHDPKLKGCNVAVKDTTMNGKDNKKKVDPVTCQTPAVHPCPPQHYSVYKANNDVINQKPSIYFVD